MPLTNISTRSRDEVRDWLKAFHTAGDSLTTTDLHNFYYENTQFRYANNEELYGIKDIRAFFDAVFPLLKSMHHEVVHFDVVGRTVYLQASIAYVVANDPEDIKFDIPAFAVFVFNEENGLLDRVQIFLDASPIFERVGKVGAGEV